MVDRIMFAVTLMSALGCGLVGGVLFAFSTFVMGALGRLTPPQGIAAMQSINIVVVNPWFMSALFGTAGGCLVLSIQAVLNWSRPGSAYLLIGGVMYLVGTIGVTVVFHVPRNNALAAVDPTSAEGAKLWASYLTNWTAGNHVRTAAALAASVALVLGLYFRRTV